MRLRAGRFVIFAAFALAGCTKPLLRVYPGEPRPPAEVAILRHQTGFRKPSVFFDRIDGSSVGHRMGDIELLPGRHVIEFGFGNVTWWSTQFSTHDARLVLNAVAGHEYEARASELPSPTVWRVLVGGFWTAPWGGSIVDLESGAVVAGVGAPDEPPTSPVTDAAPQ